MYFKCRRRGRDRAADQSVRLALAQQHGGDERGAAAHLQLGVLRRDPAAPREAVVLLPVLAVAGILFRIDHRDVLAHAKPQAVACDGSLDHSPGAR